MTQPILYIFAISHYCEKARWALDRFGISHVAKHTMIGAHRNIAKKLGAESGSLPFLKTTSGVVAGSGAIIDWGEANRAAGAASLSGADPDAVRAIEARLDDVTGVHIRRFYYSDALLNDPASVRPIFSRGLPLLPKLAVTLGWSKIVPMMIKGMDLGPVQGDQSRDIVAGELDWLDGMLNDGRLFLTGDHFTRADITAASLLAPLVNPPKHPTYAGLSMPDGASKAISQWQDRPILNWVRRTYAEHR